MEIEFVFAVGLEAAAVVVVVESFEAVVVAQKAVVVGSVVVGTAEGYFALKFYLVVHLISGLVENEKNINILKFITLNLSDTF